MRTGPHSALPRAAGAFAALACLLAPALSAPAASGAPARLHPAAAVGPGEAARTARYWSAARMRTTPPLGAPRGARLTALASFTQVAEPTAPPNAVIGRLFLRQGRQRAACTATAIDTPSRRLVLTAGHCVNSGPLRPGGRSVWSHFLQFVPAYSGESTPFGVFVAHRRQVFAPRQWVKFGNPDFDVGAVVVRPNGAGVEVADAVGGGVEIATDISRHQDFQTFGYPGRRRWMQSCSSSYIGDDALTYRLPGPPTVAIDCFWPPGSSGGGWLIDEGTRIDGLTSYVKRGDRSHTFSPYFSRRNVGRLVAGL